MEEGEVRTVAKQRKDKKIKPIRERYLEQLTYMKILEEAKSIWETH